MEIEELLSRFKKIASYTISSFALSFKSSYIPLDREGIIFHLYFDDGEVGVGEITPLSSCHQETLSESKAQLITFLKGNKTKLEWSALFSSVEFALSTALIFSREQKISVPVNGLLLGDEKAVLESVETRYLEGVRCFKLKIRESRSDDLLKRIACDFKGVTFRLDGNRMWKWKERKEYFFSLKGLSIDYLEEPFYHESEMEECYEHTGIRYAWDETIGWRELSCEAPKGLKTIVLKPSVLGYYRAIEWIKWGKEKGVDVVISHPFESGLNLTYSALMAQEFLLKSPHGFDSYFQICKDVISYKFYIEKGMLLSECCKV